MTSQRSWPWLVGVPVLCCGAPVLASTTLTGSLADIVGVLVVLALMSLAIVDLFVSGRPRWLSAVAAVVLPWRPAAFLFAPRHRLAPDDPVIRQLSRLRVVLGLVIVVGVAIWYRAYGWLEPIAFLENWALTALLAVPSCLVCMGLFVAWTRPDRRAALVRQLRWPLLSLLAFAVPVMLYVLFVRGGSYVDGRLPVQVPLDGLVYGGVFGLWLLIFCFRSAYLVAQNWFNAVDGHLLLPPVTATAMAWMVAVRSLTSEHGGPPVPVSLVLILGGATATTAVAALEAWRAMRRTGVTWRGGPVVTESGPRTRAAAAP